MQAAPDAEMSIVLPALQCPMEETEELGLEGERRDRKAFQVGEQHIKSPGGTRQCRDGANVTGALGGTCVPGNEAPEPGIWWGKGGLVLFYVSCQECDGTVRSTGNSHVPWETEVTALFVL